MVMIHKFIIENQQSERTKEGANHHDCSLDGTIYVFHLNSTPKVIGVVSPVHSPRLFEASNFEFTLYCHPIHKVSQMYLCFHCTGNVRP